MATCFAQIDTKISSEWDILDKKQHSSSEGEDLTEEMKEESILRQLTHNSVMMVAGFLDPARGSMRRLFRVLYMLLTRVDPPVIPHTDKEASTYPGQDLDNVNLNGRPSAYPSLREFCLSSTAILEPLMLFCTHAISFRDTRCCGVVLRVLRSIIPEFRGSTTTTVPIREFISSEVLKACITSLHEPYFVDLQKEIAQLIATILSYYIPLTDTPKQILLSLPGIHESSVDRCIDYLGRVGVAQRQQRAFVLDLLADLKGVSISEQGRITKSAGTVRKERSKMQQEFMKVDESNASNKKEASPNLDGVAGMFEG